MVGKLGLAEIEPDSTYMTGSGPLKGSRLLFGGDVGARLRAVDLGRWLTDLESPNQFKPFRG
jgi:hypothetical protein